MLTQELEDTCWVNWTLTVQEKEAVVGWFLIYGFGYFGFFYWKATDFGHLQKCCIVFPAAPLLQIKQRQPDQKLAHLESEEKDDFQHLGTTDEFNVMLHIPIRVAVFKMLVKCSSPCCPDHFGSVLFKSVNVLMWFSSPVNLWCHFSADPKISRVRLGNTTHGGERGTCRLSLFFFLLGNSVSAVCFAGSGVCQECWIGITKL